MVFAYDRQDGRLYWTGNIPQLVSSDPDGSNILETGLPRTGSVLDTENDRAYWMHHGNSSRERQADHDTLYARDLAAGPTTALRVWETESYAWIRVLTVIPQEKAILYRYVHHGDSRRPHTTKSTLWRMDLNGQNSEEILTLTSDVEEIHFLQIHYDPPTDEIYWTHYESGKPTTLWKANLDGSEVQQIDGIENIGAFTLDIANRKLYYRFTDYAVELTDTDMRGIRRANLDGSSQEDILASERAYVSNLLIVPE